MTVMLFFDGYHEAYEVSRRFDVPMLVVLEDSKQFVVLLDAKNAVFDRETMTNLLLKGMTHFVTVEDDYDEFLVLCRESSLVVVC